VLKFLHRLLRRIFHTTSITRFELFCGANNIREKEIIEECLIGFKIVPFDELSSNEAARIYRYLKQKGQLIGMRDILISGIAMAYKLVIATNNIKEFRRIKVFS